MFVVPTRLLAAIALVATLAAPLSAQKAATPPRKRTAPLLTVEQIMERNTRAMGGATAYETLRTVKMRGAVEIRPQGLRGSVAVTHKAPDKFIVVQTIPGVGQTQQGYDGREGWTKDPVQGLRALVGPELQAAKRATMADSHLMWRKLYRQWKVTGTTTMGGHLAYAVTFWPSIGRETKQYFDVKTFLLLRSDVSTETPAGPKWLQVVPSDYRQVGAIKVPFRVVSRIMGGGEVVTQVADYKVNVPVDDAAFRKPAQ